MNLNMYKLENETMNYTSTFNVIYFDQNKCTLSSSDTLLLYFFKGNIFKIMSYPRILSHVLIASPHSPPVFRSTHGQIDILQPCFHMFTYIRPNKNTVLFSCI